MVEQFEAGSKAWCELFCHPHQRDDSYLAEWRHFLACVSGQESPLITGEEEGLRVLQIIDAARQSSESGSQVHLAKIQAKTKDSA